ncbi:SixA phosphatase family protein [Nocardia gamkensis]|uniref:SixA phosphatase family protein n=1 Tax=Nocardia gamkensis TaxID=352869 RepID=UPI0037CA8025
MRQVATRSVLVLVRHAQPFIPRPGGPGDHERSLTGAGRGQAERLVTELATEQPAAIVSSPYLRAVQTVEPWRVSPAFRRSWRSGTAAGPSSSAATEPSSPGH